MKTQTSKRTIWSKGLLLLPLLAVLLFSFSTTEVVEKDASYANSRNLETPNYKNSLIQKIATKKMVEEYNALAKRYNETKVGDLVVKHKELKRMRYIFDRMTPAQRKGAEAFPKIIAPPKAPRAAPHAPKAPRALHAGHPVEGRMPPQAPVVEIEVIEHDGDYELMPPPPPPVPSEHMKELAAKGAVFYYEGKEISGKEAIKITKELKNINIQVRAHNSKKPVVKLSKDPIELD